MTATEIRRTLTLLEAANRPMIDTPEFRAWFRNSKIVDRNGDPLVVYHGTRRDFDDFEVRGESHDTGIYFTPDPDYASGYATSFGAAQSGSRVIPCYLSIQNPVYCLTKPTDIMLKLGTRGAFTQACIDHFVAQGHDGMVTYVTDYEIEKGYKSHADASEIVAFRSDQVRNLFSFAPAEPA